MQHQQRGFTLVELSIVLVVVGLLIGGVIAGRTVYKSTQLQSVIADVDAYKKAALLFKEKYNALPGDITNATDLWGTDTSCAYDATATTTTTATCNGNGDGFIAGVTYGPAVIDYINGESGDSTKFQMAEATRLWQHLANAGFIPGQYSGAGYTVSSNYWWKSGINIPKSKINEGGYSMFYVLKNYNQYDYSSYAADYNHVILFGGTAVRDPVTNTSLNGGRLVSNNYPILSPIDALAIDKKADDGYASTGKILSFTTNGAAAFDGVYRSNSTACSNSTYITALSSSPYAKYLTTTSIECSLIFITGF